MMTAHRHRPPGLAGHILTHYLGGQLGSLLLKQVFHLLDVELLRLRFVQLPLEDCEMKSTACISH